jgi:hypothetical protein
MATTDGTTNIYNSWKEDMVKAANLGSDVFKMLLTTSTYSPSAAHTVLANVTNELSGSGYARFEHTITTATQTSGTFTFKLDNAEFEADGGDLTARYWVIFNDTMTDDPLVAYGLLDDTPADVTITDGNKLTVNINASGLFTIA